MKVPGGGCVNGTREENVPGGGCVGGTTPWGKESAWWWLREWTNCMAKHLRQGGLSSQHALRPAAFCAATIYNYICVNKSNKDGFEVYCRPCHDIL